MSLRLDKHEAYVLCGVTDCGARVGHRGVTARRLVLLPGYRRDPDGVIRMPPKAVRRRRTGRYAGNIPPGLRAVRKGQSGIEGAAGLSPALPARVKCWDCGFVQDADAATLKVTPADRDAMVATNAEFAYLR